MTRAWRGAGLLVLLAGLLAGCSSGAARPSQAGRASQAGQRPTSAPGGNPARPDPWPIVALGDSVPSGAACGCTPFPQLTGSDLAARGVADVRVDNLAVGGATSTDVVDQVTGDAEVIAALKGSRLTEVEIGANDVGYSAACGTDERCYAPQLPDVEHNLQTIVARIHQLTAGHPSLVVLLDYWGAWLGGRYAQAHGSAYVAAAAAVTEDVSTAIKTVAAQTGSDYVDLRAAFKGPDYSYDETHYLASDGDHPNAAGHRLIASAVERVVAPALLLAPS